MKTRALIFFLSWLISSYVIGGGIKGMIKDQNGDPLPFATIYVKELASGTASNVEGQFELELAAGKYTLYFQHVGFQTQMRQITVGDEYLDLNIDMKVEVVKLQEVEVYGNEDPAYTIIRKAIAKAKYHTQQLDSFSAKVYIKGRGQLIDAPFFLRKRLKKEGVDPDRVFISESVSEIHFERPDKLEEKVISIRSSGEDNNTNPNMYITGSFYQPEIGSAVSPLSPKAFAYYRFEFLGVFEERNYTINKIRVTPRSRGEDVFSGLLYIVDDLWSIYSLDLETMKFGLKFKINQIFNPIDDVAWLPVSHKFDIGGKILGFRFQYDYLASVSDYRIHLNPDLIFTPEVIDEKIEKELADSLKSAKPDMDLMKSLEEGQEITSKQLKKALKEYEKQEIKNQEEEEIASIRSISIDTLAYKKDSTYWNAIRPIPLTRAEIKGYAITDSLAVIEKEKAREDSIKNSGVKDFQVYDLLFGKTYKLNERNRIRIHSAFEKLSFNTVEGYHFDYHVKWIKKFKERDYLITGPVLRYAFSREKLSGFYYLNYNFGERQVRSNLGISGGRYISQFTTTQPIDPTINAFETLLLNRNLMKIYEKDFLKIKYNKKVSRNFRFESQLEWAERKQLVNTTSHIWINNSERLYTPNAPVNVELDSTDFPDHKAMTFQLSLFYKPWQKYRRVNKREIPIKGSSPEFFLHFVSGLDGVLGSEVDFSSIEIGANYGFDTGPRSDFRIDVSVGKFLNNDQLYFPDFRHFGNFSLFLPAEPVKSYRLLDWYLFSTQDQFLSGHLNYQSGRFLVTQILLLRFAGIKENLFANYLVTPTAGNYVELGYGIDYIFRFFRIEAVTSFQDGKYQDTGIRIGVALGLDSLFD